MTTDFVDIAAIRIGRRYREDMGDIDGLAKSIAEQGLLQPIVVTSDLVLVAGGRRIAAAARLGWNEVPVNIVDPADLLSAERDENTCRKDFTPSEAVRIGREIEKVERERAKERQREHGGTAPGQRANTSENFTEVLETRRGNETRERVGAAVGMSGVTYQRAKAVLTAAEESPGQFGDLVEEMDRTGKVKGSFDTLQRRKRTITNTVEEIEVPDHIDVPARTQTKTKKRLAQWDELCAAGWSSRQIADKWGIGTEALAGFRKRYGLAAPPADVVIGKTRRLNPNHMISEMTYGLEGYAMTLDLIDVDAIDADQITGCVESLRASLKALNNFLKEIS